ncbi:hypothetical protein C6501_13880 [Candidatus Poribacteria bacterium]|nr:MAG: hypothetical protein C6501_13880 [Candidatus Poribacteria bacterium]
MKTPRIYNNNANDVLVRAIVICLMFCLTAFFTSCGDSPSIQSAETTQDIHIPEPVPPPTVIREAFDLDPFYQQWIDVEGLPVIASEKVNPYAVKEAAWLIRKMLQHRQDILQALVQNDVRFVVIAHNEMTTQIPEYKNLKPNYYWDLRARGLGPRASISIASCGEENLLDYPGNPYPSENILIHEFSHAIHIKGLNTVDPSFDKRLKEAFNLARGKGLWRGTYAITNREEYWAEGTQSWFDTNWTDDNQHNHVRTREQLKAYDPALAALLTEVFGDTGWRYTQAINRTHLLHLQGFNSAKSPKFRWQSDFPDFTALHEQLLIQNSDGNGKWVNLKEQDPSQIPNLKSEVNYTETAIIFVNPTEADIAYYWVDYEGNEIFYRRIVANSLVCQNTYVGHFWVVKDMKGRNLTVFRSEEKTGRAFITYKGSE